MSTVTAAPRPGSTLAIGTLLSAIGGYLDAYTFVGHGMVFANAQSANVLFAALALANGSWPTALRHIPPVLALFAGTFFVRALQTIGPRYRLQAEPVCLGVEAAVLLVNAVLPGSVHDYLVTVSISFAAALQWSAFSNIEGWSYTSIATTGNLRQLADAIFALIVRTAQPPSSAPRARAFAAICAGFALGATLGALATSKFGNAAALFPALCLIGVIVGIDIAARPQIRT